MRRLLTALSITLLGSAYAAEEEGWDCSNPGSSKTTLKLIRAGDDSRIIFDVREIPARYKDQGLDRRWDFGLDDDGSYDYAVVLQPSNVAGYIDFSGVDPGDRKDARQTFNCKRSLYVSRSAKPNHKDRANWRKLVEGASMDQVRSVLGEPYKIDNTQFFIRWHYSSQIWHSKVTFGKSGRVEEWTEPN